jgi:DNA-(apurinic or apyrimidinic site) lyase
MQVNKSSSIQNELADVLRTIPPHVWYEIVKKGPEWHELEPLRSKFPDSAFSVFMLTVGLNAYQLKGRAETSYFPILKVCLNGCDSVPRIETLHDTLAPFYKRERLNSAKLERLSRFLQSPLAYELWTASPQEIASSIDQIYHSLGRVMGQKLHEKTICFAMKCLGVSLMMANENSFDFQNIPIPVDSRINKFMNNLGLPIDENSRSIQRFWGDILSRLRPTLPPINMIHLDSFIWQIAHHDADELRTYCRDLGIDSVGRCIHRMLNIPTVCGPTPILLTIRRF